MTVIHDSIYAFSIITLNIRMSTNTDDFFDAIDYKSIVNNIKGIYTSDGTMSTLLDFERVLDQSDLYAFQNWEVGELVSGPRTKRYTVACTFMYPKSMMPDPRGGKRLLAVGAKVSFMKTTIQVPIKVDSEDDFRPGTHIPKMIDRTVWLVNINIPRELMNDIREGTVDLADQTVELEDLQDAYAKDLDQAQNETEENSGEGTIQDMQNQPDMGMDLGMDMGAPL